jgi:hypothetical protein
MMMASKILVGKVGRYFSEIGVIAIDLIDEIAVGDRVSIEKDDSKFEQKVSSIEVEHIAVNRGFRGDSVGIKVDQPVDEGSEVYKFI